MRTKRVTFLWGRERMTFAKPPLSVADQVKLLKQRGMEISNDDEATHYLTHINYYRLRAYWLPYEIPNQKGDHRFQPGTRFIDIIAIYQFDRTLRLLLLDAIERVEISLRARWANYLSLNDRSGGLQGSNRSRQGAARSVVAPTFPTRPNYSRSFPGSGKLPPVRGRTPGRRRY